MEKKLLKEISYFYEEDPAEQDYSNTTIKTYFYDDEGRLVKVSDVHYGCGPYDEFFEYTTDKQGHLVVTNSNSDKSSVIVKKYDKQNRLISIKDTEDDWPKKTTKKKTIKYTDKGDRHQITIKGHDEITIEKVFSEEDAYSFFDTVVVPPNTVVEEFDSDGNFVSKEEHVMPDFTGIGEDVPEEILRKMYCTKYYAEDGSLKATYMRVFVPEERVLRKLAVRNGRESVRAETFYDECYRKIKEVNYKKNTVTEYEYDEKGQLVCKIKDGEKTVYKYDDAGRCISIKWPDCETTYEYGSHGCTCTETNTKSGKVTRMSEYDEDGRETKNLNLNSKLLTMKVYGIPGEDEKHPRIGKGAIYSVYGKNSLVRFGENELTWRIKERQPGKILLSCEDDVCGSVFDEKDRDTTWEKSSVRKWLNGEFLEKNFSDSDRGLMLDTEVTAATFYSYDNKEFLSRDKIFLEKGSMPSSYFGEDREKYIPKTGKYFNMSEGEMRRETQEREEQQAADEKEWHRWIVEEFGEDYEFDEEIESEFEEEIESEFEDVQDEDDESLEDLWPELDGSIFDDIDDEPAEPEQEVQGVHPEVWVKE